MTKARGGANEAFRQIFTATGAGKGTKFFQRTLKTLARAEND